MEYTIEKIENGIATFRYADGSYANATLAQSMLPEEVDDLAFAYAPKVGVAPSHVAVGQTRNAVKMPDEGPIVDEADAPVIPDYLQNRMAAYGDVYSQIEYITENGLEAWQAHVAEIKAQYSAPSE